LGADPARAALFSRAGAIAHHPLGGRVSGPAILRLTAFTARELKAIAYHGTLQPTGAVDSRPRSVGESSCIFALTMAAHVCRTIDNGRRPADDCWQLLARQAGIDPHRLWTGASCRASCCNGCSTSSGAAEWHLWVWTVWRGVRGRWMDQFLGDRFGPHNSASVRMESM